jgi:hypothetical protein
MESGGIAPRILNLNTSFTPLLLYSGDRSLSTHWIGAGLGPYPVCTPSCPARSVVTVLTELHLSDLKAAFAFKFDFCNYKVRRYVS